MDANFEIVKANSKKRIAVNPTFNLIDENAKWIFERKDDNVFGLSLEDFKKEMNASDAKAKKFKTISEYNNKLKFSSLPDEIALFTNDTILKQKRERWHEELQKDIYVEETLNIILDMKSLAKGKGIQQKLSMN